jgi:hypothetical protein
MSVCVCGGWCVGSVCCLGVVGWLVMLQKVASGGVPEVKGECLGDTEAKLLQYVDLRSRCGV